MTLIPALIVTTDGRTEEPSSRKHHLILFLYLQVSFVVKAVSALTAAFRLVQLDSCGQVGGRITLLKQISNCEMGWRIVELN